MIIIPNGNSRQIQSKQSTVVFLSWRQDLIKHLAYENASYAYVYALLTSYDEQLRPNILIALQKLLRQDPIWLENRQACWLSRELERLQEQLQNEHLLLPGAENHIAYHMGAANNLATHHFGMEMACDAQMALFRKYNIQPQGTQTVIQSHHHYIYPAQDTELQAALEWQAQQPDRKVIAIDPQAYSSSYQRYRAHAQIDTSRSIYDLLDLLSPTPKVSREMQLYLRSKHPEQAVLKVNAYHQREDYIQQPTALSNQPITYSQFKQSILEQLAHWQLLEQTNPTVHQLLRVLKDMLRDLCMLQKHQALQSHLQWHKQLVQIAPHYITPPMLESLADLQGSYYQSVWVLGFHHEGLQPKTAPAWIPDLPPTHINWKTLHQITSELITSSPQNNTSDQPHQLPKGAEPTHIKNQSIEIKQHHLVSIQDDQASVETASAISASKIQDYAQCPFKAFARHHLKLRSLEIECLQPNAAELGNLAHQVLEHLYKPLKDQNDLHSINQADVQLMIEQQWQELKIRTHPDLTDTLQQELKERILSWIKVDLERPFFTIHALEHSQQIQLQDTQINLRVDRIDLADQQMIILDYKTGYANISDALNPQFTSPQLPLYALAQDHTPQISYGMIQQHPSIQLLDLADDQAIYKRQRLRNYEKKDFETMKQAWTHVAQTLVQAFMDGHFAAKPASPLVCQTCDFQTICRKHLLGHQHATN